MPSGSAPCPNYCGLLLNPSFHLGLHLTIICAPEAASLADSHPGPPRAHLQVAQVHGERPDVLKPTDPDAGGSAPSVGSNTSAGVSVCFQAASDALSSLGHVYTSIGDYPNALASHKQCVLLARQTQCQLSEARQLGNMGAVYTALGDFTNAVQCHEQHLSIAKVRYYSVCLSAQKLHVRCTNTFTFLNRTFNKTCAELAYTQYCKRLNTSPLYPS